MSYREEEIDRFRVKTDSGKEYIIIAYQQYISTASYDDPNVEVAGKKRLMTLNGFHVNFIYPKTFKIVETNEIVQKVS